MSRRATVPGADELFRTTSPAATPEPVRHPGVGTVPSESEPIRPAHGHRGSRTVGEHHPSGRERHDEKITVYCSPEELVDLERARLTLRAEHGLAIDRGRIVREALAVLLADLDAKGQSSILVQRLRRP